VLILIVIVLKMIEKLSSNTTNKSFLSNPVAGIGHILFWLWDTTVPFSTSDYKLPRERKGKQARCWDKLFSL